MEEGEWREGKEPELEGERRGERRGSRLEGNQ